ncbi:VOC family protein [Solicola sp. PLA-1-18]|uniref:VOC family protein n=1 Tax=Solicola sp. PLA-1-18 TaxID=3380532 RepID=UPI003B78D8D1
MATVTGPSFVALQVRDVDAAAEFYASRLGLRRAAVSPPGAVVFDTAPISFAVRNPLPGVDLDAAVPRPGVGVALWLHADDAATLHHDLDAAGVTIAAPLADGPFGPMFTFVDLDGYAVTIHGDAA